MFKENPELIQEEAPERGGVDFSGTRELQIVLERLGLKDRTVDDLSPGERQAVLREGEEMKRQEMMIPADKTTEDIAREIANLFESRQPHVSRELAEKYMGAIHQHFLFLIETGKATREDERRYFEYRLGWEPRDDESFTHWDNILADLSTLQRERIRGAITEDEFTKSVLEL